MKQTITKQECIRLIYLTTEYDIYLWVFKQLFIKGDRDYKYYMQERIYISRITMDQNTFNEVRTLLQKYYHE